MTITSTKTTDYTVTFHWVAEAWTYDSDENGEAPMTSSDPVTVTLPTGSTPWEVYGEADAIDQGPEETADVSSWDGDGMTIDFDGKSYSLSGELIKPETQWSDFY